MTIAEVIEILSRDVENMTRLTNDRSEDSALGEKDWGVEDMRKAIVKRDAMLAAVRALAENKTVCA